jgi:hypothetical protein
VNVFACRSKKNIMVLRNIVGDDFAAQFVTRFKAFEVCVVARMMNWFVKSVRVL